jgi:hypothetical protein
MIKMPLHISTWKNLINNPQVKTGKSIQSPARDVLHRILQRLLDQLTINIGTIS